MTLSAPYPDNRPSMLFDGSCPLCRREVAHYQRLDKHRNAVNWVDIQQNQPLLDAHGISHAQAMQRLHVITAKGCVVDGAAAFVVIWEALPYYRWLARLTRLPGVVTLMEFGYRHFARWRFKRRCREGVCEVKQSGRSD